MTEQNKTRFLHKISFDLITLVDIEIIRPSFVNFMDSIAAKTEEGVELTEMEVKLAAFCKEEDLPAAINLVISTSFGEYLDEVLKTAQLCTTCDGQDTFFDNVKINSVVE